MFLRAPWNGSAGRLAVFVLWAAALTAFFFSGRSGAIDVPLESCSSPGFNCPLNNPVYNGPGPANWETAIQLSCRRFTAAHRVGATTAPAMEQYAPTSPSVTSCRSSRRVSWALRIRAHRRTSRASMRLRVLSGILATALLRPAAARPARV